MTQVPSRRPIALDSAIGRRRFLTRAGAGVAAAAVGVVVADTVLARGLAAQEAGLAQTGGQSAASNVEMTADSYKPVRRPPKPNATRVMDDKQLEAFERNLACPCPCTLDIFTCRTTDFTCGISPAVHRDLQALVEGGYGPDEIMSALSETYGDFILMAPRKEGFSLLAWFAPFAAVGVGAVVIGALLRGWRRNAEAAAKVAAADAHRAALASPVVDATSDELAKLEAALRDDSR
jgi:cytochrome c-type biogenesis protein CcmH